MKNSDYKFPLKIFYIFPYFAIFTLVLLFLELFSYRGFIKQFLFIDSISFLLIFFIFQIISIFVVFKEKNTKKNKQLNYLLDLNSLLFPSLLFLNYFISELENNHYSNYVFSTYHINPNFFNNIIYFSVSLVIMKISFSKRKKIIKLFSRHKDKKGMLLGALAFFVILHFFSNGVHVLSKMLTATNFIVRNTHLSYEEKMQKKWGIMVPYSSFINKVTEPNSNFSIPPQAWPWGSSGNAGLMRYFLYPRVLKNSELENAFAKQDSPDYILISKGTGPTDKNEHGWPKHNIQAEEIHILDLETEEITSYYNQEYLWEDERFHQKWGVIKLRKELKQ